MGYSKIMKLLSASGLSRKLQEESALRGQRSTDLMEEDRNDKGLDRRR